MAKIKKQVSMGAIMCVQCDELIDTFDAEKVITYYSRCNNCAEKPGGKQHEH